VVLAVWLAVNPFVFGKPAHHRAWSTRAMLGEELWISRRPRDAAMFVSALSSAAALGAVISARRRRLVPAALAATRKGGTVVCGGIHMSDIPAFPYRLLGDERVVRSVANLTRRDGEEFFALAAAAGIRTITQAYPLSEANRALTDLRTGALQGAAVLVP
jgi:D-arabinose 1-dehydrogenase-like Zn-dependent alcohol dehydrogenase